MGCQRVPKMLPAVNNIPISASFFMPGDHAGFREMPDDAHGGALSDADADGNIPHPSTGVLGEADQDMRVIAQKIPFRVGFAHDLSPVHDEVSMI